ncbi:MAG: BRO-N domain-containing protein [Geminicoccaceae bacterium]
MADMRLSAPAPRCEPNLYIFEGQNVRVIAIKGDPWFAAKAVAELLGYTNPQEAVRTHCKGVSEIRTPSPGGPQLTKIISERDVYRLIMRSKLPAAQRFEDWVVGEILPTIRRTGSYAAPAPSPLDDHFERLLIITEKLVDVLSKPTPRPKSLAKPKKDPWAETIIAFADAQTKPFRLIEMFPAIAKKHGMSAEVSRRGHEKRIGPVLRANGYANRKMRLNGRSNTMHWEKLDA